MEVQIHPCLGVEVASVVQKLKGITTSVKVSQKVLPKSVSSFWPAWRNRFYKSDVLHACSAIVAFDGRSDLVYSVIKACSWCKEVHALQTRATGENMQKHMLSTFLEALVVYSIAPRIPPALERRKVAMGAM